MSSILDFPPAPWVTAAVEEAKVAVSKLASLVAEGRLDGLSESELLAVVLDLQALGSQVEAVTVTAVAEVRDGEVAKSEGFTSTTRFLEAKAGLSKGESRAQVALGEKLAWEFEATAQAWLAGEVSEGAVQVITWLIPRKLKGLPEAEYFAERTKLEAMALHHARTKTVGEVRRAIERAAIVADPAGALDAAVAAKRNEFLSFTPTADGVEVRGFLAWDTAGVVLPCFDQAHDAMYRNGQLAEDYSDDADLERVMSRTPSLRRKRREHRNAQILAELATRLLDDGELGTKHAQRPHLTVTVHADDFAAGLGGDILLPGFGPVPVPNETIERFLCDAEIHPVLTRRPDAAPRSRPAAQPGSATAANGAGDRRQFPGSVPRSTDPPWRARWGPGPGGVGNQRLDAMGEDPTPNQLEADTDLAAMTEFAADLDDHESWWNRFLGEPGRHVLDVGRSRRTAPPKIRRALTIRDGGCAAPGCDTDPSRCEAHHITYWEHHGETSISNMVLLCTKHHHMVHEGRWRIQRNTDVEPGHPGYLTLVAPARRA
jgi:hypothetical protein